MCCFQLFLLCDSLRPQFHAIEHITNDSCTLSLLTAKLDNMFVPTYWLHSVIIITAIIIIRKITVVETISKDKEAL